MSVSLLSLKSEEAKAITNGRYKCKLDGSNLVITDGVNTWTITQSEFIDLEQRLTAIINGKADLDHTHSINDVVNLQSSLDAKANSSHTHSINDVINLQSSLDAKANSSHTHEFADIYKSITVEGTTTTKTLQQVLNEYEQSLTTAINGKANSSHTHDISDIYVNTGPTTTTVKSLETLMNEREADIRALITAGLNGKANSSHTHQATEVIYKAAEGNNAAVNVKQQLDTIMNKLEVVDSQGHSLDILKILFGADAIVGGAIDGGLAYAVATLQGEIAALQTEISANGVLDLNDDALELFDTVGDLSQGTSVFQRLINAISNWCHRITASLRGYTQVTTYAVNPLAGAIVL